MINVRKSSCFLHDLGRRVLRPLCAIALLLSAVTLVGCSGSNGNRSDNNPTTTVSSIAIWEADGNAPLTALELNVDAVKNLVARATYSDGSTKKVDATWKSSDTSVVTVDNGTTTGVKAGTAEVTASFGGKETTIKATVKSSNLKSIIIKKYDGSSTDALMAATFNAKGETSFNASNVELPENYSAKFEAWGSYSDGSYSKVNVNWNAESGSSCVTFDTAYGPETVARGENLGTAIVTASASGIKSEPVDIQVTDDYLQETVVKQNGEPISSLGLIVSDSANLEAYGKFSNGQVDPLIDAVWNSSQNAVTVEGGKVVAIAAGEDQVSAADPVSMVSTKVSVVVTENDVESIYITGGPIRVAQGSWYYGISDLRVLATMKTTGQIVNIGSVASLKTSNKSVATVSYDSSRKSIDVFGEGAGSTDLYCEYQGVTSNKVSVEVIGVKSIVFGSDTASVPVGRERSISVTTILTDGSSTASAYTLSTSDSSVAVAEQPSIGYGIVTIYGLKQGSATITASVGNVSASCRVTVTAPLTVESISLDRSDLTVHVDEGSTIEAIATMSDGSQEYVRFYATWISSDTSKATVDSGQVYGVSEGTTNVSCTYGGKTSNSCTVTVKKKAVIKSITISPSSVSLVKGSSEHLQAVASYDDQSTAVLDVYDVTWYSSNTSVAIVDEEGYYVVGLSQGTAKITCEYQGITSSECAVTVKGVSKVTITANATVAVGGDAYMQEVDVVYSDGSKASVYANDCPWYSDDASIAVVTDGRVNGIGHGETDIWCTYGGVESNKCSVKVFDTSKVTGVTIGSTVSVVRYNSEPIGDITVAFEGSGSMTLPASAAEWDTDDADIVEVFQNYGEDVRVYGNNQGTAHIWCTLGSTKSNDCTVTVTEQP